MSSVLDYSRALFYTPLLTILSLHHPLHLDPVLIAYGVQTTKTGRNSWRRLGEAYAHEEGAGLTVLLDALPPDGKIVLLERDERDDARLAKRAAKMVQR